MKNLLKTLLTICLLTNPIINIKATEGIKISSENFPDKEFRKKVKESMDLNNDGYLTPNETKVVYMFVDGIKTTKGLKYFENTTYLNLTELKYRSKDIDITGFSYLSKLDSLTVDGDIFYNLNMNTLPDNVHMTVNYEYGVMDDYKLSIKSINRYWKSENLKYEGGGYGITYINVPKEDKEFGGSYVRLIYKKKDGGVIYINFVMSGYPYDVNIKRNLFFETDLVSIERKDDIMQTIDFLEVYRKTTDGKKKVKACKDTNYCEFKIKDDSISEYIINSYLRVGEEKILLDTYTVSYDNRVYAPGWIKLERSDDDKKLFYGFYMKNKSVDGYQIYVSTKRNGTYKRIRDTKNIEGSFSLDSKHKYVKARTYKTINGKTVYSSFNSKELIGDLW